MTDRRRPAGRPGAEPEPGIPRARLPSRPGGPRAPASPRLVAVRPRTGARPGQRRRCARPGPGLGLAGDVRSCSSTPSARRCRVPARRRSSELGLADRVGWSAPGPRRRVAASRPAGHVRPGGGPSFGPPAVTAECGAPFLAVGGRLVVSEPPAAADRCEMAGRGRERPGPGRGGRVVRAVSTTRLRAGAAVPRPLPATGGRPRQTPTVLRTFHVEHGLPSRRAAGLRSPGEREDLGVPRGTRQSGAERGGVRLAGRGVSRGTRSHVPVVATVPRGTWPVGRDVGAFHVEHRCAVCEGSRGSASDPRFGARSRQSRVDRAMPARNHVPNDQRPPSPRSRSRAARVRQPGFALPGVDAIPNLADLTGEPDVAATPTRLRR